MRGSLHTLGAFRQARSRFCGTQSSAGHSAANGAPTSGSRQSKPTPSLPKRRSKAKRACYRHVSDKRFGRRTSPRPRGGVVTQRSAKPFTPVQFRAWPPLNQILSTTRNLTRSARQRFVSTCLGGNSEPRRRQKCSYPVSASLQSRPSRMIELVVDPAPSQAPHPRTVHLFRAKTDRICALDRPRECQVLDPLR